MAPYVRIAPWGLWPMFIVGTLAWFYIIYEIFAGEASKISHEFGTEAPKKMFQCVALDRANRLADLPNWI